MERNSLIKGKVYNLRNVKNYYIFIAFTNEEDVRFLFKYKNKFGDGLCYKDKIFVKRLIKSEKAVQVLYGEKDND